MEAAHTDSAGDGMSQTIRILIVLTSHSQLGSTGKKTGFWLEELAAPYLEFARAGAEVDLASPAGGAAPADPRSETDPSEARRAFLADPTARAKLQSTLRLADVRAKEYDAIFVAGGHGTMWDLATDPATKRLLSEAASAGKVVAAVCHGPAALVGVEVNGVPLVKGRRVSAFTDAEERAAGLDTVVPFPLEGKLRELGARLEGGPLWAPFAVRDGTLVTGQNPASAVPVAREVLRALGRS
jgi:putative intracellular protease/amidase